MATNMLVTLTDAEAKILRREIAYLLRRDASLLDEQCEDERFIAMLISPIPSATDPNTFYLGNMTKENGGGFFADHLLERPTDDNEMEGADEMLSALAKILKVVPHLEPDDLKNYRNGEYPHWMDDDVTISRLVRYFDCPQL